MKLKRIFKIKFILLFFILFTFLLKINPIKNLSEIINYELSERLENIWILWWGVLDILNILKKFYIKIKSRNH